MNIQTDLDTIGADVVALEEDVVDEVKVIERSVERFVEKEEKLILESFGNGRTILTSRSSKQPSDEKMRDAKKMLSKVEKGYKQTNEENKGGLFEFFSNLLSGSK